MLPLPPTDCGFYAGPGISVTADTVSIDDTVYATAQITSVSVKTDRSVQVVGWVMVLLGLLPFLIEGPKPVPVQNGIALVLFIVMGLIPALWGKLYLVQLTTSARERGKYVTSFLSHASMVAGKIGEAMIAANARRRSTSA